MNRFEAAPEAAMLPVDEVIDLHQFVMDTLWLHQYIRGRRQATEHYPGKYGVSLLDTTYDLPRDNTGSTDTYLSVLVKSRPTFRSMLICFNQGINSEAYANSNEREFYRIFWNATQAHGVTWSLSCMATEGNTTLIHDVETSAVIPGLLKGRSAVSTEAAEGMRREDLSMLQQRMQRVSIAVGKASTPIV